MFNENILPELTQGARNEQTIHPIIIVDSIKFVLTFRSQLTSVNEALSVIMQYLSSSNFIVYTYAAICIEKILSTRIGSNYLISADKVGQVAEPLLSHLITILQRFIASGQSQKLSENENVIKAVLRVLLMSPEKSVSIAAQLMPELTKILSIIGQNPSNPKFNHYVFESIAALIRAMKNDPSVRQVETFLFPPFQSILQAEISGMYCINKLIIEFMPYVFQILSQLLDLHPVGDIPEMYLLMVTPLTQPGLWQSNGKSLIHLVSN